MLLVINLKIPVASNGCDALSIPETCHQFQLTAQSQDIGDQRKVDVLPFFDLGDVGLFDAQSRLQVLLTDVFVFA